MKKHRYFVETVPSGQPTRMSQIAHKHHAVWIDDTTSFGLGEFDIFELDKLANESTIHLFESPVDDTPAHQQVDNSPKEKVDKQKTKQAFSKHGVNPADTIQKAALKIAKNTNHKYLEP